MKKLLCIFIVLITIIMVSCDLKSPSGEVITRTQGWCLTRIDSVTILCAPQGYNDSIKPFIIKTNNNEIN